MSQEYASKQPQGFENHITKVAIVGAGGSVGRYLAESLVKTGKHQVTAITRADSTNKLASGLKIEKVNYDDTDSLAQALQGQEVLIITMGTTAPQEQHYKLVEAAAKAKVQWVVPNEWGYDTENEKLVKDIPFSDVKLPVRQHIEKLGISWVGITCGFWYEFSLGGGSDRYGVDFEKHTMIFFDDGKTPINTSTWHQCGNAIASLLSLKVLPDDENDKAPTLSQFRNKMIYTSSFNVNQKEMFDSVLRVTGTSADDWKVSYEDSIARYKAAAEAMQTGSFSAFVTLMYTRVFFQDGVGNFEASKGIENEVLGLPKEDLDEYTKAAVEYAKAGKLY
ncbi:MAG: hypothetical protein Q9195_003594 [Heterodermia aff. obscurata]